jgi:UDP-glucose 4-epimerase
MLVADPAKARELLGWMPTVSDLDSILRSAWTWHLQRHPAPATAAPEA